MAYEARRDVFQAIADPTRREIIGLVVKKPQNLNALAENFNVSRPAISQHVKGRERYCEARLDALNEVSAWIEQYKQFWEQKLDALETYLEKIQQQPKAKKNARSK